MKKTIIFLILISFCFSINTNWVLHNQWVKIVKKDEKKKKIGKFFLIIAGIGIHSFVLTTTIKNFRK